MATIPKPGEVYRHFKGTKYVIVDTAMHTETGERLVIYRSMEGDGGTTYARPIDMFVSRVDTEKYPDATQKYRFELQAEEGNVMDPMLSKFLDADTYEERLNIMVGMRDRVDKGMLTTMAIACDITVPEGDISDQFEAIRYALLTRDKYEGSRLR